MQHPAYALKKSAVQHHLSTKQHKDAVEAEMLGRVSVFHKEGEERKVVEEDVMFKDFMAAYWVITEEISNRMFLSLIAWS